MFMQQKEDMFGGPIAGPIGRPTTGAIPLYCTYYYYIKEGNDIRERMIGDFTKIP